MTCIVGARLAPLEVEPRANGATMPERHWGGIASYCQSVPPSEQERHHEGNEEPHDGVW